MQFRLYSSHRQNVTRQGNNIPYITYCFLKLCRELYRIPAASIVCVSLLITTIAYSQTPATKYKVSPDELEFNYDGAITYDINLTAADGSDLPTDLDVIAQDGSHITKKSVTPVADKKTAIVKIQINADAVAANTVLRIVSGDKVLGFANLKIVEPKPPKAVPQQPVPGGAQMVDATWMVVPDEIVRDNFGKKITDQYYCIEIVIGNNSGYDLQIAGVSFDVALNDNDYVTNKDGNRETDDEGHPKLRRYSIPTSSRRMVRQTIVREQNYGQRALTVNGLKAVGTLASGFIPFFHVAQHMANFSTGTSIFANQFEKVVETSVLPDLTTRQLGRVDEEIVRDGMLISNNRSERAIVFIPKPLIERPKEKPTPDVIMRRLGDLRLVGKKVELFQQREIIIRRRGENLAAVNDSGANIDNAPSATGSAQDQAGNNLREGLQNKVTPLSSIIMPPRSTLINAETTLTKRLPGKRLNVHPLEVILEAKESSGIAPVIGRVISEDNEGLTVEFVIPSGRKPTDYSSILVNNKLGKVRYNLTATPQ